MPQYKATRSPYLVDLTGEYFRDAVRSVLDRYGQVMQVWLDNLFIRVHRISSEAAISEVHALNFNDGKAWMTNTTMQSDAGAAVAIKARYHAHVYAESALSRSPLPCSRPPASAWSLEFVSNYMIFYIAAMPLVAGPAGCCAAVPYVKSITARLRCGCFVHNLLYLQGFLPVSGCSCPSASRTW